MSPVVWSAPQVQVLGAASQPFANLEMAQPACFAYVSGVMTPKSPRFGFPVQTLEGHAHNVSAVMFHPELPVILTGSEDGSVRMWHSTTYRLENTLNYGMERVWALACTKGSNSWAPAPAHCACWCQRSQASRQS